MKANELRIGNLVGCDISTLTVKDIYEDTVSCVKSNGMPYTLLLEEIFGIPLTEEWLLRFGFERVPDECYELKDVLLQYWDFDNSIHYVHNHGCLNRELKYVHQLQNLYFALTGEELTIK